MTTPAELFHDSAMVVGKNFSKDGGESGGANVPQILTIAGVDGRTIGPQATPGTEPWKSNYDGATGLTPHPQLGFCEADNDTFCGNDHRRDVVVKPRLD